MSELSADFVIIGGGIAGVSCAEILCQLTSGEVPVLMISGSTLVRVAANVAQLTQSLVQFDVQESSAEELQNKTPGLQVLTGVTVTALDPSSKLIKLSNGRTVRYKKSVCICTGARPRQLPGAEACGDRVLTLRDIESVNSLENNLKDARRVEIEWLVRDKHISAAFVDPGAAQFFLSAGALTEDSKKPETVVKRLRYTGAAGDHSCMGAALGPDWHSSFDIQGPGGESRPKISVEYECEVQHILQRGQKDFPADENDYPLALQLSNGKVISADLVVVATGVVPNCEVFASVVDVAPVSERGGGIRVDKIMQTSVPDVYAAGDVALACWPRDKHWFQMRLWTQARQMGTLAGRAMATPDTANMFDFSFESFAHMTKFFGYKVVLLGLYNGQGMEPGSWEALVRVTPGKEYVKLVLADGKVHGAVLVGETELEETFDNLILNQTDVGHLGDDLLNPSVDIDDYFD
ncbi:hypothetical protein B566_EDAN011055 [Ephemera danica]|nr:hypothetical protein B566_EDAN011055 [Ephemera danica]